MARITAKAAIKNSTFLCTNSTLVLGGQVFGKKSTEQLAKEKIEKATWFKAAIAKRDDTLKKVFSAILNIQEAYFISGNEKDLKPMKLADIAQVVNMDISTISRVSNSKYVFTHFGTLKLKDLFFRSI